MTKDWVEEGPCFYHPDRPSVGTSKGKRLCQDCAESLGYSEGPPTDEYDPEKQLLTPQWGHVKGPNDYDPEEMHDALKGLAKLADLPDEYYPPEGSPLIPAERAPKPLKTDTTSCMHDDCQNPPTHTLKACYEEVAFCKPHYREVRQLMALDVGCPNCGKLARVCWEVGVA